MDDTADNPGPNGTFPGFSSAPYPDEFSAQQYTYTSEWVYPELTVERRYNSTDTTRYSETSTRYRYDNPQHFQLTGKEERTSRGDFLVTRYRYPLDFDFTTVPLTGPGSELDALRRQHMLAVPVEVQSWRRNGNDSILLSARLVQYANLLPKRTWQLTTAAPVKSSSVVYSVISPDGTWYQDPKYREDLVFDAYDTQGHLLQQHRSTDGATCILWGYGNTLPIAEIHNATRSQVQLQLQQLGLAVATLHTDSQVRDAMAQLRVRLPFARITSFTHQLLAGISSETDPSGRTSYYEYDGLGRLLRTRDEQGRILSQEQYHYARP